VGPDRRACADPLHRTQRDFAGKAINAARMALRGDGFHRVTLDQVIDTMRATGADMHAKYKETSAGGLAINLAVNIVEC
jgi:L-serine dehydratase